MKKKILAITMAAVMTMALTHAEAAAMMLPRIRRAMRQLRDPEKG